MTLSPQALSIAISVPLIVLIYYRRFRRLFGRQLVREGRMITRVVILALVGAMLLAVALRNPLALAADAGGLALGAALGWWGLRLTRFERRSDGVHYIPHGWFGIGIAALLAGRLIYRFMVFSPAARQAAQNTDPFALYQRSPMTLALFGLLVGYYVYYYIGVLRMAKKQPEVAG
ncbi:MAG TPA: DUF1453 domain-containing protein [Rhodanobacteraceae bacterium]|nr:DUF1453 domain-containing protein [Rhodanobacteraceae bacterium]